MFSVFWAYKAQNRTRMTRLVTTGGGKVNTAERRQLLEAAADGRWQGWLEWELDEYVRAVARRRGIAATRTEITDAVAAAVARYPRRA